MTNDNYIQNWGVNLEAVECEVCEWTYLLPPNNLPKLCPHCYRAELTPLESLPDEMIYARPPEAIIPFTLSPEKANRSIQDFAKSIPFAPARLQAEALQSQLQMVFLPMWLVDSQVQAKWQAEAGFNYKVVSHQEQFSEQRGGWSTRELTETRIRWEPRLGRLTRIYHNTPLPALEEDSAIKRKLGRYNPDAQETYHSDAIGPALVRLPNRAPDDAWSEAPPALKDIAGEECRRAAEADHIRQFQWQPAFDKLNWTQLLLPIYTTYYLDDDDAPHPILIHGQSGRAFGSRRASMKRAKRMTFIIGTLATVIFVCGLVLTIGAFFESGLLLLGGLGLGAAFVVGLGALAPLFIAWQFNQKQQRETWFIPQHR